MNGSRQEMSARLSVCVCTRVSVGETLSVNYAARVSDVCRAIFSPVCVCVNVSTTHFDRPFLTRRYSRSIITWTLAPYHQQQDILS